MVFRFWKVENDWFVKRLVRFQHNCFCSKNETTLIAGAGIPVLQLPKFSNNVSYKKMCKFFARIFSKLKILGSYSYSGVHMKKNQRPTIMRKNV